MFQLLFSTSRLQVIAIVFCFPPSVAAQSAVQGNLILALHGNQIDVKLPTEVYFKAPQCEVTFSYARLLGSRRVHATGLDIEIDQNGMKFWANKVSKPLHGAA